MQLLILLGIAIVIVVFYKAFQSSEKTPFAPSGNAAAPAFASRETLLTACELNFFRVLEQSVPNEVWISSKVRLADVLKPKNPKDKASFNKICAKHLDFVLCDRQTSKILCAIELNDSSHDSFARSFRDGIVEEWLTCAGIKVIPIKAANSYKPEELRRLIGLQADLAKTNFDADSKYKPA